MTESPEQPTNADLMAYMIEFSGHVMAEFAKVRGDIGDVRRELADVKDELRGEIRATEATLTARIDSVQQVVRSVKADLAAHVNDPDAHHRHAA